MRLFRALPVAALLAYGDPDVLCAQEVPGANEWMRGVRHEKRGKVWYHCEPWIRQVLRD